MKLHNNFETSYGLIVKTKNDRVMIVIRKVPYCVQNYYAYLHKNNVKFPDNGQNVFFEHIRNNFESDWLSKLEKHDLLDYQRFIRGEPFEDLYDFPHGQMQKTRKRNLYEYFMTAYREFKEETGYRFYFTKEDVMKKFPVVKIEFRGCDDIHYKQFYFIVENVKDLKRNRYFDNFPFSGSLAAKIKNWNDDRLVFKSLLMPLSDAYKFFENQQNIKTDFKHLLLQNYFPKYYIICNDDKDAVEKVFS